MNSEHIERIIQEVNRSMSMEGMPLTEADWDGLRKGLEDPSLFGKVIANLVKRYSIIRLKASGVCVVDVEKDHIKPVAVKSLLPELAEVRTHKAPGNKGVNK